MTKAERQPGAWLPQGISHWPSLGQGEGAMGLGHSPLHPHHGTSQESSWQGPQSPLWIALSLLHSIQSVQTQWLNLYKIKIHLGSMHGQSA